MRSLCFVVPLVASAGMGFADAPQVVTDIAPVHSLVARVMDGVGTPDLVVPQGAGPHDYALRPSNARALEDADIIFWIGPGLTPALGRSIEQLAGGAQAIGLLDHEGTQLIESAGEEGHADEHDDHADDHAEHGDDHSDEAAGHDDHAGEDADHSGHADHDEEAEHAGHDEDHADHHDHGAHDPHAWLDPANAALWMEMIAETLAEADAENADLYRANAAEASAELTALSTVIDSRLAPVRDRPFIVFHDAYKYFETAYDLPSAGSIALSDATRPGPAKLREIQSTIRESEVRCVLAEPQFDPAIVTTVSEGMDVRTELADPLGSTLELGPDLYVGLLEGLTDTLVSCLSD